MKRLFSLFSFLPVLAFGTPSTPINNPVLTGTVNVPLTSAIALSTDSNGNLIATPSQSANTFWAAPSSGSGAPSFRVLVTSDLPVLSGLTYNGLTITSTTGTLTIANSKTLKAENSLELAGTDSTVMTFPGASTTVAGLGTTQTFTAVDTFSNTTSATTSLLGGVVIGNGTGTTSVGIGAGKINAGSTITGTQLISNIATGTAPFAVTSTTNVANLNASSLSGATFASPGSIGSTSAGSGAFTTLSASSTVSGTGFSTYLASPPAIGGTTASTGKFTTATATTSISASGTATLSVGGTSTLTGNVGIGGAPYAGGNVQLYMSGTMTSSFYPQSINVATSLTAGASGAYMQGIVSSDTFATTNSAYTGLLGVSILVNNPTITGTSGLSQLAGIIIIPQSGATNNQDLLIGGSGGPGGNFSIYEGDPNPNAFSGASTFSNSTASSSTTTGAVIVTGGVGIGGAVNLGGNLKVAGSGGITLSGQSYTVKSAAAIAGSVPLVVGSTTYYVLLSTAQ